MSAYDDLTSFLDRYLASKTEQTRPTTSARVAKKQIEYGEDPLVAAQNFETFALGKGWSPKRVARKTRRILDTPVQTIAAEKYTYAPTLVERAYQDFYGRVPTQEEIKSNIALAGAKRINPGDPSAFESLVNTTLTSSPEGMRKIKTPEDIAWERQFGPMVRSASGDLQRGMVVFRPEKVAAISKQLREAAFSPIANLTV